MTTGPVDTLAGLVVQRITLGQDATAAKYTSRHAIEDPIRERQALEVADSALKGSFCSPSSRVPVSADGALTTSLLGLRGQQTNG